MSPACSDTAAWQLLTNCMIRWTYLTNKGAGAGTMYLPISLSLTKSRLGVCTAEVFAPGKRHLAVAESARWPNAWIRVLHGLQMRTGAGNARRRIDLVPGASDRVNGPKHHWLRQHAASAAMRLMFNAKHTRCHSPRTLADPRPHCIGVFARSDGHAIRWGNPPGIDTSRVLSRDNGPGPALCEEGRFGCSCRRGFQSLHPPPHR